MTTTTTTTTTPTALAAAAASAHLARAAAGRPCAASSAAQLCVGFGRAAQLPSAAETPQVLPISALTARISGSVSDRLYTRSSWIVPAPSARLSFCWRPLSIAIETPTEGGGWCSRKTVSPTANRTEEESPILEVWVGASSDHDRGRALHVRAGGRLFATVHVRVGSGAVKRAERDSRAVADIVAA